MTVPIYEFYCRDCHVIYSFFSPRVDPGVAPRCPSGKRHHLTRKPSTFATPSSAGEGSDEELIPGLDETRMERAMQELAGEFAHLDPDAEEDPKVMAQLFRRFSEAGGLAPGPVLEEMLARMESVHDMDELESELEQLGDHDADLDQLFQARKALRNWRRRNPRVDETLHFL